MLAFILFTLIARADELGQAPASPTVSVSSSTREPIDKTLHELTAFTNTDLEKLCKADCSYDADKNVTTCKSGTTAHHKMRCQNILWSAGLADDRRYKQCEQFMVSDHGNLGPLGDIVFNEIVSNIKQNRESSPFLQDNPSLLQQRDNRGKMQELCPAFNSFDDVTRAQFYLYLMENIAYRETSCTRNDAVNNHAPTTAAVCVFQLEQSDQARAMRPPACRVKKSEITKPENCGKCAVQMMAWHLGRPTTKQENGTYFLPDKPFGTIDAKTLVVKNHAYWQALNPETPKTVADWHKHHPGHLTPHEGLMNGIRYFPPCRASLSKERSN